MGKHKCPGCGLPSRLRITFSYVAWVLSIWMLFFGIAFALTLSLIRGNGRTPRAIPLVALIYGSGCLLIAMLDKFYDERFRKLEKMP
jgi:hypothetical protein